MRKTFILLLCSWLSFSTLFASVENNSCYQTLEIVVSNIEELAEQDLIRFGFYLVNTNSTPLTDEQTNQMKSAFLSYYNDLNVNVIDNPDIVNDIELEAAERQVELAMFGRVKTILNRNQRKAYAKYSKGRRGNGENYPERL